MSDKAMPPMKVRKDAQLGATIDGYTMLPVFNYVKQNIYDDISWEGCNYANGNGRYKYFREDSYSKQSPYFL